MEDEKDGEIEGERKRERGGWFSYHSEDDLNVISVTGEDRAFIRAGLGAFASGMQKNGEC